MKIAYDESLNAAQLEAVMAPPGPLLVIAGAGSGKTRTLTYRVARLVERASEHETVSPVVAGTDEDKAPFIFNRAQRLEHILYRTTPGIFHEDNTWNIIFFDGSFIELLHFFCPCQSHVFSTLKSKELYP